MDSSAVDIIAKATYQRLNGAVVVDGKAVQVFDEVPDGQEYPYIVIEGYEAADYGTKVEGSDNVYLKIGLHSDYRGFLKLGEMMRLTAEAMDSAVLDLSPSFEVFYQTKYTEKATKSQDVDGTLLRSAEQVYLLRISETA